MEIPEWEEIAIPEGFGPYRLLYNPPSETVIAELQSVGKQFLPNQIYNRRKNALKNEPITDVAETESSESAVTCHQCPLLFYLSNSLKKLDDHHSGDWLGLHSIDLESRKHHKIADKNTLKLPPPYVEGWITGLVSASADGSELYLTVGMMPPDTSSGFQIVNHQLARNGLDYIRSPSFVSFEGRFFLGILTDPTPKAATQRQDCCCGGGVRMVRSAVYPRSTTARASEPQRTAGWRSEKGRGS